MSTVIANLSVREGTPEDLPSLSNIAARSFHKTNAWHRRVMPDTPLMREWFKKAFQYELDDPRCRVLTVVDHEATDPTKRVLGVLLLRLEDPGDPDAGPWTKIPLTDDHDQEAWASMVTPQDGAAGRPAGMESCFGIELLGVDDSVQRQGLGGRLLQMACHIADQEGYDILVRANMYAKAFYTKFDFEVREETILPGPEQYGLAWLVYQSKSKM